MFLLFDIHVYSRSTLLANRSWRFGLMVWSPSHSVWHVKLKICKMCFYSIHIFNIMFIIKVKYVHVANVSPTRVDIHPQLKRSKFIFILNWQGQITAISGPQLEMSHHSSAVFQTIKIFIQYMFVSPFCEVIYPFCKVMYYLKWRGQSAVIHHIFLTDDTEDQLYTCTFT